MTREPVDGVMCVVWLSKQPYPKVAAISGDYWNCADTGQQFHVSRTTHWTTLDEAKAAPELVEAARTVVADYSKAWDNDYDENRWADFGGVQPLADALAKIGAKP